MKNTVWQEHDINKSKRSEKLRQTPCVIWFTGLSGSGKSTLANALEVALHQRGKHTYLLDGDNIRQGLCSDLGFDEADRAENIRRIAHTAKLMVDAGLIILCAFVSPSIKERQLVRQLFSPQEFVEVYVSTPLDICEKRDPKGLYQQARVGNISLFTGVSAPYQVPEKPEITLNTANQKVTESVQRLIDYLQQQGLLDYET